MSPFAYCLVIPGKSGSGLTVEQVGLIFQRRAAVSQIPQAVRRINRPCRTPASAR